MAAEDQSEARHAEKSEMGWLRNDGAENFKLIELKPHAGGKASGGDVSRMVE